MTTEELKDLARNEDALSEYYKSVNDYCDAVLLSTSHLPEEDQGSCDLERHGQEQEHAHFRNGEAAIWMDH